MQCAKCPWRKGVDPNDIPNGYEEQKHCALNQTIAEPGRLPLGGAIHVMACHETDVGAEKPCVGWLVHQAGIGNNLALRLMIFRGEVDMNVRTIGPQHKRFEDTLPKNRRKKKRNG